MAKRESTAARVRRLREQHGLTPTELAERTGIGRATLYRLERANGTTPRMATLVGLSKFFGLSIRQVRGSDPLPEMHQ